MRPAPARPSAVALALALALPPLLANGDVAGSRDRQAPYRVLDRVEGAWPDLALAPVRPLAVHPATGHLFALNAHDSAAVEFDAGGAPLRALRTPWGPVALAFWSPRGGAPAELLVVSRGTYALARIDLASGAITKLVELPAEPADIVVHPGTNTAFVSCSGDDSVVEVDVERGTVVAHHAIPSKRPTFLALDGDALLVAPMLSGNNSAAEEGAHLLDAGRVLDLADPAVAHKGLPDEDLFRWTPGGRPRAVATGVGAVLFAVGVNPVTGDVWQLGTDAKNKDPNRVGEPALRGDIVQNRLALVTPSDGPPAAPWAVLDLDDVDPGTAGTQFDPTRAVGQPYALAFDAAGNGYVTGLLTDNVTEISPAGAFVREWDTGSIPRGVLVDAAGARCFVHCWGSNEVEEYDLAPATPQLVRRLDLGLDPTPEIRRRGRRLFYDGSFSMHGNASCATCHVETETDMLAWDLSDLPADDKGPLVTQTMRGIGDLTPFHWRGERAGLVDFNGAFDALLGGAPMATGPGGDFEAFRAFVFSLEQPANPNQDPRRVVSNKRPFDLPDGTPLQGDAVAGQDTYFDVTAVQGIGSCNTCHTMPTGTSNEITLDEPNLDVPRRNHFVVASYNGVWRKESPTLETIELADGTLEQRPTIGAGVSAAGLRDGIKDFVDIPLFTLGPKQRRDVSAFVMQADSGLAPAVHRSWLLGGASTATAATMVSEYLLPQAQERNADVAVFGTVEIDGQARELRWFWNRVSGLFASEDTTLREQPLAFFVRQAERGTGSNVFLGLPVGMAERFAVDFDADGLRNGDEENLGTDPSDADSDGDGDPDGHETAYAGDPLDPQIGSNDGTAPGILDLRVVYATNRVAKIQFETDEPARFTAGWTSGLQSGEDASGIFEKSHTVVFRGLRSNQSHDVTLEVVDLGGNATTLVLPGFVQTLPPTFSAASVLVDATTEVTKDSAGALEVRISGRAKRKNGPASQANRRLRVKVIVNGVVTQQSVDGVPSNGTGITTVDVAEAGLAPGDELRVVVESLVNQQNDATFWSMPDTAPEMREFRFVYTGNGP